MVDARHAYLWLIALTAIAGPLSPTVARSSPAREPIIDMHLHAAAYTRREAVTTCPGNQPFVYPPLDPGAPSAQESAMTQCLRPIRSAASSIELMDETIAALRRHNVRRGVLIGTLPYLEKWRLASPDLFIPATAPDSGSPAELSALRQHKVAGKVEIFAEVGTQYAGKRADDPTFEPFWALAEEMDAPVGIHLGEGMPGQIDGRDTLYRAGLTSPFQLETVLIRHPRLRLYVMHAASPLTDEMISMLFEYPRLYVDISANDWAMPRAQFYDQLKRLVDAGFSKRIMFGSDQTIFPQAIGLAIQTIREAPFLTNAQKRDILYNNAARFLRLTPQQIAADHR